VKRWRAESRCGGSLAERSRVTAKHDSQQALLQSPLIWPRPKLRTGFCNNAFSAWTGTWEEPHSQRGLHCWAKAWTLPSVPIRNTFASPISGRKALLLSCVAQCPCLVRLLNLRLRFSEKLAGDWGKVRFGKTFVPAADRDTAFAAGAGPEDANWTRGCEPNERALCT
jgi:hypothetical protein